MSCDTNFSYDSFLKVCNAIFLGNGNITDEQLRCTWTSGGASGGSCYGGEVIPHAGEPEPEFDDLTSLLAILCPKITFLQYKKLYNDLVKTSKERCNDYYGNFSEYTTKSVSLQRLYNWFVTNHYFVNLVIVMTGLPGSGKTMLAKQLGGYLYDDPGDVGLEELVNSGNLHNLTVITDPRFIRFDARQYLIRKLAQIDKLSNIMWLFFENDPESCIVNIKRRKKANEDFQCVDNKTVRNLSKTYQCAGETCIPVWKEHYSY